MAMFLYYHPLSSYCQKAVIALYEAQAPFEPLLVNLGDSASRAAFLAVWPIGKFPVLKTDDGMVVPESSIIIEYLARRSPHGGDLVPADERIALQVRKWDRVFDSYLHLPMQQVIGDRLRSPEVRDPHGVTQARRQIRATYDLLEGAVGDDGWMVGDRFTMADCSAAPPLCFAGMLEPFEDSHPRLAAYYDRLKARPSVARTFAEADPYRHMVPQG